MSYIKDRIDGFHNELVDQNTSNLQVIFSDVEASHECQPVTSILNLIW